MEQHVNTAIDTVVPILTDYGLDVLGALALLVFGWMAAAWAERRVRRTLDRAPRVDATLKPFIAGTLRYVILAVVLVGVLAQFGVQTTSIIAVLGAAGLAVGLAMQGTLSNVAAGVMLLILRPFRVGEYVDAGGIAGTVKEIGLFATELTTADGVCIVAPNAKLWNAPVTNFTRNPNRRMDVVVGIAYDDDIEAATRALMELMQGDSRVLDDPAPQVLVTALADSAVNLTLRCWATVDDFWPLQFDLNKRAKLAVEAAGCTIPFPQRDVHVIGPSTPVPGQAPLAPGGSGKAD